jgi:pimeloyl-ACP methyl ester carboxylesterase
MPQSISFQGCSLSFSEQGTGEPVVFIQGVGLHGEGWRPQTEVLQMAFRCVTFDNRGMGASQPLTGKLTLEQMATDTLAVMDAAGIASAHLVGHSLGGCIAQQVALAFPSRVKSLSCCAHRHVEPMRQTCAGLCFCWGCDVMWELPRCAVARFSRS